MKYSSPVAFRTALERRLVEQARSSAVGLGRLRRRVVFERMLVRLETAAPGRWILKGGTALELRWRDRARATRDLDLAMRVDGAQVPDPVHAVSDALSYDPDGDWFVYLISAVHSLRPDEAGRPGWRLTVEAQLAGKAFDTCRVDVVMRHEEITGTERLWLPGALEFAEIRARDVEAVDRRQHYAEKLHAYTAKYGDRPNTRVKDLADLVMLIEDGLPADDSLVLVVRHVFSSRATHAVPRVVPMPRRIGPLHTPVTRSTSISEQPRFPARSPFCARIGTPQSLDNPRSSKWLAGRRRKRRPRKQN